MSLRNKIYFVICATLYFVSVLFFLVAVAKAADTADNNVEQQNPAALEQHKTTLLSIEQWIVDGEVAGFVAAYVYKDVTTERAVDYLELYDKEGDLVAISWFDQFGIQRVAIDRGIVEGEGKLEGTFVAVWDGDPV
jgi:hypothetical protein